MTAIVEAFDGLRALARTGSPFRHDQVYANFQAEPDEVREALVGRGYDIVRTVQVPDSDTDTSVGGTVSIRVIDADGPGLRDVADTGPALILRVNLTWTTSSGGQHRSYALYTIPVKNAAILEEQTPPDMSELEALGEDADSEESRAAAYKVLGRQAEINGLYGADWRETFPGSVANLLNEADDGSDTLRVTVDDGFMRGYEDAATYHMAAVNAAKEVGPSAACLLSGSEGGGAASPDEIVTVYEWLREQPEVAAAA